jgi:hypothetical protein
MKGEEPRTGTFLGMPYDWRRPTSGRYRQRFWNSEDPRLLTPRAFGWGYNLNFYRLVHPRKKQ